MEPGWSAPRRRPSRTARQHDLVAALEQAIREERPIPAGAGDEMAIAFAAIRGEHVLPNTSPRPHAKPSCLVHRQPRSTSAAPGRVEHGPGGQIVAGAHGRAIRREAGRRMGSLRARVRPEVVRRCDRTHAAAAHGVRPGGLSTSDTRRLLREPAPLSNAGRADLQRLRAIRLVRWDQHRTRRRAKHARGRGPRAGALPSTVSRGLSSRARTASGTRRHAVGRPAA